MALLEIQDVTRRFGDFTAVDDVSLAIEAGEFFTLLGPSGCGKTTLLRMIAGFDLPDGGRILLNGEDLADQPPEARPVRTVFQSYALFPHMTVEGNVAFPLQDGEDARRARSRRKVAEALEDVRLDGLRQALSARAFRRPEAARRDRARARHASDGAAARRAARRARREAARGDADRAHQPAEGGRHHVRLRDARPDRGAGAVAPHRGDEHGPRRAARRAVADLRLSAHALRRRLHRPLQPARRAGRGERRRHRHARRRRPGPGARGAASTRRRRRARARSRCARRRSASRAAAPRRRAATTTSAAPSPTSSTWATSPSTSSTRRAARRSRRCSPTRRAAAPSSSRSATRSR